MSQLRLLFIFDQGDSGLSEKYWKSFWVNLKPRRHEPEALQSFFGNSLRLEFSLKNEADHNVYLNFVEHGGHWQPCDLK